MNARPTLMFQAEGRVTPQGSKMLSRYGNLYEASPHLAMWRATVKAEAAAALALHPGWNADTRAVCAILVFVLKRPKSHYRTNGDLKPWAPEYATTTPDVDKACRAVLDALTEAGAFADDRFVVQLQALKRYTKPATPSTPTERPGVLVVLQDVTP